MKARKTVLLSIVSLLVVLLGGSVISAAAQSSSAPAIPHAASTRIFIPVVDKDRSAVGTITSSSDASLLLVSSSSGSAAPYSPQPGDSALLRDKVFIDYSKTRLLLTSSSPYSASIYLVGNLPDPCHVLRITKGTSVTGGVISVLVYSLVKPGTACVAVLQPFAVTYPLGTYAAGQYRVLVNGTSIGTFGAITLSSTK